MARTQTRTRILVASLTLFNEKGEPNTSTNEIANEVDISPGNLHYHFRKKSALVDSLLAEFQADARNVLEPPPECRATVEDFWAFLQLLLELLAAYRFLLRDMETLVVAYPNVRKALGGFSRALVSALHIYINALCHNGVLVIDDRDVTVVCRNLVVIALFSERFDAISGERRSADDLALRTARSMLGLLQPYTSPAGLPLITELTLAYE